MDDEPFLIEPIEGTDGARLRGELDVATYDEADAALAPLFDAPGDVVLDVSELGFVDSSGIRLFIRLRQSLAGRGELILRAPQRHVARVIEVAGLHQLGIRVEPAE